jgi:hypothetical protein
MSLYEKAIQIFQEQFMFGFNSAQEIGFTTLFADSDSMVRQFLSFNEEQRDIFVAEKKTRFH